MADRLPGPVEFVVVETRGDAITSAPIHTLGGVGVFVKEVQQAVLDGQADLAVHSAKDLPAAVTPGLTIASVPQRADPRDSLVGSTLAALRPGATVATGAVRRRAQLAALRPDLHFAELRGNIDTRLAKAANFDAVVVARAALDRLDLASAAADTLAPTVMLPQVGQGALALECRDDDEATVHHLHLIDDPDTHRCLRAERAFLAELGGGCELPCGAHATIEGDTVVLDALLAALDGSAAARATARGTDPEALGRAVAEVVLDERGGRELLAAVPPA